MSDDAALKRYADATVRRKSVLARHMSWWSAATQALEGLDVRNKGDHDRLVPQILGYLERRGDKPIVGFRPGARRASR